MGVTYKLRDEVVQFIISQRQGNPLFSCRQLAESASQKFGLNLSKSSVHDVLKESGIVTPRGRKPKDKFKIPQEKKQQIQASLSKVKLISPVTPTVPEISLIPDVAELQKPMDISAEYEGAGRVFLKAALWDLGIYSEENIKESDWKYYLTYAKGVKVVLENSKTFFIDLPVPLERCIREVADGLINNVKPLIVNKVSDEGIFKACMEAQPGFKINSISIVEQSDHKIIELSNIVEQKRNFILDNRIFMESNEKNMIKRANSMFFLQTIDNYSVIDNILNLKGFDTTNDDENIVTLLIANDYENKNMLQEAVEKLNGMYLTDDQNKLVKVQLSLR